MIGDQVRIQMYGETLFKIAEIVTVEVGGGSSLVYKVERVSGGDSQTAEFDTPLQVVWTEPQLTCADESFRANDRYQLEIDR